ncbi:MAG: response regulator transcription factor [Lewinellaceae bacterium]|nr:response regulator transcription factor [Lewinellaceae bacterium]
MRLNPVISTFVLVSCSFFTSTAQQTTPVDSGKIYLNILDEQVRNGNFENAQIEALHFRNWLTQSSQPCQAEAVTLVNGIYLANKDIRSAYQFLGEAEMDARYDRDPVRRSQLLKSLVKAFEGWDDPPRALSNQKLLEQVRDSSTADTLRAQQLAFKASLDSLKARYQLESGVRPNRISMERNQAVVLGVISFGLLLGLLMANYKAAQQWRKRLLHKDIEMDLLRANLRPQDSLPPFVVEAHQKEQQQQTYPNFTQGEALDQTVLIIEPNRQVVLYLKSLLSDQFLIETAPSATEGLQMANKLLPDLIVCDAVLNGQTGIDVSRQIKLSDKTNHIPIILLSERYGNEGKLDALRAGAEAWFTRPVLDKEIGVSVAQLQQARKERQAEFATFLQLYFSKHPMEMKDPFLQKTVELVAQKLRDPDFMADDLARVLQLTNHHFSKKLKALTGKEPAQLIREMRLEKAKVLLESRAVLPQNVSELVGFSNPGSFAMAFKDYFGENTLLLR